MGGDDRDRDELDPVSCGQEGDQRFRLDLEPIRSQRETGPRLEFQEPEAALRIRQPAAGAPGQLVAHPAVHDPPQPLHPRRGVHPITHHQGASGLLGAKAKARDVFRGVLSVGIESHRPAVTALPCRMESGSQRGAFAPVDLVPDDLGTGGSRGLRGTVEGTVVHHDHPRHVHGRPSDQRTNRPGLVQGRKDGCARDGHETGRQASKGPG